MSVEMLPVLIMNTLKLERQSDMSEEKFLVIFGWFDSDQLGRACDYLLSKDLIYYYYRPDHTKMISLNPSIK